MEFVIFFRFGNERSWTSKRSNSGCHCYIFVSLFTTDISHKITNYRPFSLIKKTNLVYNLNAYQNLLIIFSYKLVYFLVKCQSVSHVVLIWTGSVIASGQRLLASGELLTLSGSSSFSLQISRFALESCAHFFFLHWYTDPITWDKVINNWKIYTHRMWANNNNNNNNKIFSYIAPYPCPIGKLQTHKVHNWLLHKHLNI